MNANNSARRLYDILYGLDRISGQNTIAQAIAKYFNLNGDMVEITTKYIAILQLVTEVEKDLAGIEQNEAYMEAISELKERMFKPISLNQPLNHFTSQFDSHLRDLVYCADVIARYSYDRTIEKEEFKELNQKIDEFIESLHKAKIDPRLKDTLFKNIREISSAILNYQLYGTRGLEIALERGLGSMVINSPEIKKDEEAKNYAQKFLAILTSISSLVNIATQGPQLAEHTLHLLGM